MSTRTITGNLAADPEVVQAGSIHITKLRVQKRAEYWYVALFVSAVCRVQRRQMFGRKI